MKWGATLVRAWQREDGLWTAGCAGNEDGLCREDRSSFCGRAMGVRDRERRYQDDFVDDHGVRTAGRTGARGARETGMVGCERWRGVPRTDKRASWLLSEGG